jgi:hypothetical protein
MKKAIPRGGGGWFDHPGVVGGGILQSKRILVMLISKHQSFKEGNMNFKAILIGVATTIAAMYIYDNYLKK